MLTGRPEKPGFSLDVWTIKFYIERVASRHLWGNLAATSQSHNGVPTVSGMVRKKGRPMRVIHTSDWHLGQELHGFDRSAEHDAFLDWLARQSIELEADAIIVTGDVYTRSTRPSSPNNGSINLSKALTTCPHLQIVLIGGNHDSAARLGSQTSPRCGPSSPHRGHAASDQSAGRVAHLRYPA